MAKMMSFRGQASWEKMIVIYGGRLAGKDDVIHWGRLAGKK